MLQDFSTELFLFQLHYIYSDHTYDLYYLVTPVGRPFLRQCATEQGKEDWNLLLSAWPLVY